MINKNMKKVKNIKASINTDDATATENDILEGETAYARGYKLFGTIKKRDSNTEGKKFTESDDKIIMEFDNGAYLTASDTGNPQITYDNDKMKTSLQITAEKIIKGNSICGVEGTATILDLHPAEIKTIKKIKNVNLPSVVSVKPIIVRGIFDNENILFFNTVNLKFYAYNLKNFNVEELGGLNFNPTKKELDCCWCDGEYTYISNVRYDKNFNKDNTYSIGVTSISAIDIDGKNEIEMKVDSSSTISIRKKGENTFKELVSANGEVYNMFRFFGDNYMYRYNNGNKFFIYDNEGSIIYSKSNVDSIYTKYDKGLDKAIVNVIYKDSSTYSDIFYLSRDGKTETLVNGGSSNFLSSDIALDLDESFLYLGSSLLYTQGGNTTFVKGDNPVYPSISNAGKDIIVWSTTNSFIHYQIE